MSMASWGTHRPVPCHVPSSDVPSLHVPPLKLALLMLSTTPHDGPRGLAPFMPSLLGVKPSLLGVVPHLLGLMPYLLGAGSERQLRPP